MSGGWVDVTGRGVISSAGHTVPEFSRSILAGEGHIGPFEEHDRVPLDPPEFAAQLNLRFSKGAPVRDFDPEVYFDAKTIGGLDRYSQFAAVAARQAWKESGLDVDPPKMDRVGVIVGTANTGNLTVGQGWRRLLVEHRKPLPLTIPMTMGSAPASRIAREIGALGPVFAVSSACASAAHAILMAVTILRAGLADVMVVGGADACYDFGYLRAWDALRVVSTDICRPFSKGRLGLSIGEGAGMIVLETAEHARARGARALAHIAGGGMTSDAGDLTSPDLRGMVKAIHGALASSGLPIDRIGYVNAHGTGTQVNDRLEAAAIREVFGAAVDRLPVSSTKSAIGHAMGAAGALELLATIAMLEQGVIAPTLNFTAPDPECALDVVPEGPRKVAFDAALSNSFAFGGLNVTLAITRAGASL